MPSPPMPLGFPRNGTRVSRAFALLPACVLPVAVLLPGAASAQTITVGTTVTRVTSDNEQDTAVRDTSIAQTITRADCEADQGFQFQLTTTGYTTAYTMEVWASRSSVDCRVAGNRQTTTGQAQKCWRIYPDALPRTTPQTVNLRVRDIMANDVTKADAYVNAKASNAVCGVAIQDTFKVSFLMLNSSAGSDAVIADDSFTKLVDTLGPTAVTEISAQPGEGRLLVSWAASTTPAELTRFDLYCAEASGTTTITDAGKSTCAGGSALVEGSVPGTVLPAGMWKCGSSTSGTSTGGEAKDGEGGGPLANGKTYAVAVAAVDTSGNVGPLSAAACATPALVDDFYETYQNAGGTAGCAVEPTQAVATKWFGLATLAPFGALAWMLRKRPNGKGGAR